MSITIEYLWKDRKRHLGMPLSFTRYQLSEDRLFLSQGFLNIRDDDSPSLPGAGHRYQTQSVAAPVRRGNGHGAVLRQEPRRRWC